MRSPGAELPPLCLFLGTVTGWPGCCLPPPMSPGPLTHSEAAFLPLLWPPYWTDGMESRVISSCEALRSHA